MKNKEYAIETLAIHAGEGEKISGAITLPIFQSSTFLYQGETQYEQLRYIRLNNTPNHRALHTKIAVLEGAEAALVTASGMAAISAALLTVLRSGDHILLQRGLYGGTHDFATRDFQDLGIEFDFIDASHRDSWAEKLRSSTRAIYVEAIANPLMEVGDLKGVVDFARRHDLISLIDSTFATPINFRPLEIGFDLVLHSCTKYMNGHTDIVAGAVAGSAKWIQRINRKLLHLGGSLDPHAAFLLQRGLKTLSLRVRYQNRSAQKIAEYLDGQALVKYVNYPGLVSNPSHERASRLFSGFGGMLSFELDVDFKEALGFPSHLELAQEAPSLGGVETLITFPSRTSHSGLSAAQLQEIGLSPSLIRLSVGIENPDDLIADLDQALKSLETRRQKAALPRNR